MGLMLFPLRLCLLVLVVCLGACAGQAAPPQTPLTAPTEWRVDVAKHLGLWYHGLAYLASDSGTVPGEGAKEPVLPLFAPGYVERIVAAKRQAGVYPTPLDQRAAKFADLFAGDDYAPLQFVPLYFKNDTALFSAIRVWQEVDGDPRRVSTREGAQVIAFLSNMFPRASERRAVGAWTDVLEQEAQAFYDAYWRQQATALRERAAVVQREWDALAPELGVFLDYMELEGGTLFLVPALGAEGRIVARGPGTPVVAVLVPPPDQPEGAVFAFIHELVYPIVGDVVREHVAPARIREIGRETLETRAAVRGGAFLLDRVAPDRAAAYRRFFLEYVGAGEDASSAAFREAFPLPEGLEAGLAEAIERTLAGI